MRISKIRDKKNSKLSSETMTQLVSRLKNDLIKAGFKTKVYQVNGTSIHIGMHMCSFTIDTDRLGYNARINNFTIQKTKLGYKRTNTPTWGQREQFNHIVNDRLDKLKIKANIKSGEYSIRDFETGRINEWDMPEPFHNTYGLQVPSVLEIVKLPQATQAVEWYGVNAPWVAVGE